MVRRRIVLGCGMLMARRTNLIAFMLQLGSMRIVAIGAANAFVVHFALQERTVNVVLVQHLPSGLVNRPH